MGPDYHKGASFKCLICWRIIGWKQSFHASNQLFHEESARMLLHYSLEIVISHYKQPGIFQMAIVPQRVNKKFPTITSRHHENKIRSTRASGPRTKRCSAVSFPWCHLYKIVVVSCSVKHWASTWTRHSAKYADFEACSHTTLQVQVYEQQ